MIKAAIFDMDGLLIDSEPLWLKAFQQAFKAYGLNITEQDMLEIRGHGNKESVSHFYRKYKISGQEQADTRQLILDDMVDLIKSNAKHMAGVHKALEVCKEAGLPLAVASSSDTHIIDAVMDALDLRQFFDLLYSAGEHEEYSKPHPGVFISTANLLGVEPRYCVVFEDAPAGVLAAKAAKMKCIAVPEPAHKGDKFIQTADVILNSLEEFDESLLKSL